LSPFRASAPFTESWEHFDFALDDKGIATVTFSRPDKLNALTFDSYADLRDLLGELPNREDVKVLVIAGTGRGFSSGGDVHEIIGKLLEMDSRELADFTRMTGQVVQRMRELPMPIVASVNGIAAGAGSVIALAADLRLLARSASYAFLFTKVGLAGADMGSAYLLPRLVGLGRATELLLLGDRVDADTAERIGIANRVVEDDELSGATRQLAERLASGPTFAFAATKMLLTRELDMDMGGSLELEAMTQALLMTTNDHREFYEAFKEGRNPVWTGR
jgi:enoyl-CoA hydratase/carnithine racemase